MNNLQPEMRSVKFPALMHSFTSDKFLTYKEEDAFLLYFVIGKEAQNVWKWGKVTTTPALLAQQLSLKKDKYDNTKSAIDALNALEEKGWINISYDEDILRSNTLIVIEICEIDEDFTNGEDTIYNGFIDVTQDMFESCNSVGRLFRAVIFAKWHSQKYEGKKISHNEWKNAMGTTEPITVKLTNQLYDQNLVDRNILSKRIRATNSEVYHLHLNGAFYGSGSYSHISSLLKDYVCASDMYGKARCKIEIINISKEKGEQA